MAQGLIPQYVSRYDVVEAHYFWNVHHHHGQFSTEYARLCRIQRYFRPGRLQNDCDQDSIAQDIYNTLCAKRGCTHPDGPLES